MRGERRTRPSLAWTLAKFAGRIVWKLIDIALVLIGTAGVPNDLTTWRKWIDAVMHDPLVNELAQIAVQSATFVNQWWVRLLLVAIGLAGMFWGVRPFWRLQHQLKFRWRQALAEKVWIPKETALTLIKESRWGQIKEPRIVQRLDIGNIIGALTMTAASGLSETQKKRLLYEKERSTNFVPAIQFHAERMRVRYR